MFIIVNCLCYKSVYLYYFVCAVTLSKYCVKKIIKRKKKEKKKETKEREKKKKKEKREKKKRVTK